MTTKVPKFYYRPDLNILESVENPSPLRPEERTTKKADPTAGSKYVTKEQRIYEALKLPGYESPAKSDRSFAKLEKINKEPLVKQFRNDDPTTYLTNENQQKGMLLATIEDAKKPKLKPPKKINTYAEVKIPIPTINHSLLRNSAADAAKAAAIEKVRQYAFSKRPDPDVVRGIGSFRNTIGKQLRANNSKTDWKKRNQTTYKG
tara:strand:- start:945 stop:1556 length:612 start_codon:yes stop_codon:yes gene_type:complete